MSVVDAALAHRATVFFLLAALLVLGLGAYGGLPREKYPDIEVPVVFVTTVWPGAAPADIERQLTDPLERELAGVDHLKRITSRSMEGVSLVSIEFLAGTPVDPALQRVRDRVDLAAVDFPDEAEESRIEEISFSQVPVLQVHMSGEVGPVVLKQLAEDLQDELEAIPGVLSADLVGGLEREVRVEVDRERLAGYGLSLDDVVDAVREGNVSIPGGDLDRGRQSLAVRVPGEVDDPTDIGDFVVRAEAGRPVFVRDVAAVRFGFEERKAYARIDGRESVALLLQKRIGANVLEVVERAKATVEARAANWPAGVRASFLSDESLEIRQQVADLENSIVSGLLLVVIVLMTALGFRTAVFVALSIPFSMLLTFVVLQLAGITLNMVVLFSLVLAVGMLVDNAVVVIENIYRHMEEGGRRREAASRGTREVAAAITVSTFTTVAAFSPLLFWPGVMGDFMRYLPLTVCLALLSSLVVAFTINPVLCSVGLRARLGEDEPRSGVSERVGTAISARYQRLLEACLRHRLLTLTGTFAAFLGVVAVYGVLGHGVEFIAEEQPSRIKVDIDLPPGTPLEVTDEVTRRVEARLADLTDLRILAATVGEGAQSDDFSDAGPTPHAARLLLDLVPRGERSQISWRTLDEARAAVGTVAGAEIRVEVLADDLQTGPPVAIELGGDDFATLGAIARRARAAIEDIPGLVALEDDFDLERPELVVRVDRVRAGRLGLAVQDIASTVRTAVHGTEASVYRGDGDDDEIDVVVRLAEEALGDLERLPIVTDDGAQVPLSEIATIERDSSLVAINHADRRRLVTVSGQVTRPELAGPIRTEALERLAAMPDLLPPGYTVALGGQNEEEEESRAFLERAFLYALILVLALMVGKFDSFAIPVIIITSVVMSLVGVLLGLLVTATTFSIVLTGVGIISLAGIVVNNAIVLLDYAEQQRALGLERRELVVSVGLRRLRPVLLTAVTTILGLLPLTTGLELDFRSLTLSTGSASSDYWGAMGVAVIFGLAFATFLTLVVVPVLYDLYLGVLARRTGARSEE
ncbi:MAG: efflux RND transporter permease subunit [Acidobacteriota bacterium]